MYPIMAKKLPVSIYVLLFLYSSVIFAEEELPAVQTKNAEESQAIIEQTMDTEAAVTSPTSNESTKSDTEEKPKAWIPSAVKYDWVQLTSNEWLKGDIKGMYNSLMRLAIPLRARSRYSL